MRRSALENYHFEKLLEYHINRQDANDCICFTFEKGETILREGMLVEYLFVVVSGKAKVCVSAENGNDFLLSRYVSKGIIGDVELMTDSYEATTSIVTITEFECIAIPYQKYAAVLKMNNEFLRKIGYELSMKLINTSKSCKHTALYSAQARLCACLLQTADHDICNEPLTELASAVGTSYRHIQRIVKQLCEKGVIIKLKSGYQIVNKEYLLAQVPLNYLE